MIQGRPPAGYARALFLTWSRERLAVRRGSRPQELERGVTNERPGRRSGIDQFEVPRLGRFNECHVVPGSFRRLEVADADGGPLVVVLAVDEDLGQPEGYELHKGSLSIVARNVFW